MKLRINDYPQNVYDLSNHLLWEEKFSRKVVYLENISLCFNSSVYKRKKNSSLRYILVDRAGNKKLSTENATIYIIFRLKTSEKIWIKNICKKCNWYWHGIQKTKLFFLEKLFKKRVLFHSLPSLPFKL